MPRLLLLRHSKAERSPPAGGSDHERVLSKRGCRDAAEIGRILAERGEKPDRVLCSSSERTRQTWAIVAGCFPDAPAPVFLRAIFEAGGDYLDLVRREGGEAESLLLVGHNPVIRVTAMALADSLEDSAGKALAQGFPTSAVAVLDGDNTWSALSAGSMNLSAFIRPSPADGPD